DALALRGLFGAALREPVPATLSASIGGAAARAQSGGTVVELTRRTARPRPVGPWLAAASIACLVVGGLARFFGARQQGRQQVAQLQQQLAQMEQRGWREMAQLQEHLTQVQQQAQRDTVQLQQQVAQIQEQGDKRAAELGVQLDQAQQHLVDAQQQLA